MYADFSAAAVAPQVDVRDARAGFQEQFELLESAKLISLAGDDDSKLKLASLPTRLRLSRPDLTFAVFMMMVVVMVMIMAVIVIVIVIAMVMIMAVIVVAMVMVMAVIVIAVFAVRVTFVVMAFAVVMSVIATGAMNMLGIVIMIAIAVRSVNVMFFVRRSGRSHLTSSVSCSINGDGVCRHASPGDLRRVG
jgi:hypothetical protein